METSNLSSESEKYYIERVNNYKNVVCEESKIFGYNVSIPDFAVIPGENTGEINDTITKLVKDRTKSQIEEAMSDIFWDFILVAIVSFIISIYVHKAIDKARTRAIDRFIYNVGSIKGNGFFKTTFKRVLYGLGVYDEYKEEVDEINAKYKTREIIIDISIFIISFILSWYIFIIPQLRTESEINTELTTKIIESSNTFNLNPERLINRYLNIEGTEEDADSRVENAQVDQNSYEGFANASIPEWEPIPISENLAASNFSFKGTSGNVELSSSYDGLINQYPVVMRLELYNDGTISCKYAYKSTLRKYGDHSSSWLKLRGAVFFDDNDDPRLVLRSINPETGKTFEYFEMAPNMSALEGKMFNIIHIDDIENHLYYVQLTPND